MTVAQRRKCFAIAARLPGKPDLHDVFGVASLHDVTFDAARTWIDQHNGILPPLTSGGSRGAKGGADILSARRPRRAKGTLALASPAQRKYLSDLYLALAPRITAERLLHYLRHHGIPIDESNGVPQFRHAPYSNIAARAAITQFKQLRAKCGTGVPPVDVQDTINAATVLMP